MSSTGLLHALSLPPAQKPVRPETYRPVLIIIEPAFSRLLSLAASFISYFSSLISLSLFLSLFIFFILTCDHWIAYSTWVYVAALQHLHTSTRSHAFGPPAIPRRTHGGLQLPTPVCMHVSTRSPRASSSPSTAAPHGLVRPRHTLIWGNRKSTTRLFLRVPRLPSLHLLCRRAVSCKGHDHIQVVSEVFNRGDPWRSSHRGFFLLEQPNG